MIRSFGDRRTEALFRDQFDRDFQGVARSAKRKLEAINAESRLSDLVVPPSNRLEKLRGVTTSGASSFGGPMANLMMFRLWIITEARGDRTDET